MHLLHRLFSTAITLSMICAGAVAQPGVMPSDNIDTLFENVRIFDGKHEKRSGPMNVLVKGNRIEKISAQPIATEEPTNIIPGDCRTLMPGLIDNHWHTMLVGPSMPEAIAGDLSYLSIVAVVEARAALGRGFTTVRDLGGPSFALKRAIDEGVIPGPRIYPSGAMITITGGHGDFRSPGDLPRNPGGELTMMERINGSQLADSPDEVRLRTREQLLLGASQIKLAAGGGVASPHSPLDVSTPIRLRQSSAPSRLASRSSSTAT